MVGFPASLNNVFNAFFRITFSASNIIFKLLKNLIYFN